MVARWLRLSQACPQGTVLSDAEEPAADVSPALCARAMPATRRAPGTAAPLSVPFASRAPDQPSH